MKKISSLLSVLVISLTFLSGHNAGAQATGTSPTASLWCSLHYFSKSVEKTNSMIITLPNRLHQLTNSKPINDDMELPTVVVADEDYEGTGRLAARTHNDSFLLLLSIRNKKTGKKIKGGGHSDFVLTLSSDISGTSQDPALTEVELECAIRKYN